MKGVLTLMAVLVLTACTARAADDEPFCGGTDEGVQAVGTSDSVIVARMLFVGFPGGGARQNEPTWADTLVADLKSYIWAMSRGRQRFSLTVMRRIDDSSKAWISKRQQSYYTGTNGGVLNTEIMQSVDSVYAANSQSNIWSGVEMLWIIHSNCIFTDCGVGGRGGLSLTGSVPSFSGTGTHQHLNDALHVNHAGNRTFAAQVAGHEYGHLLNFGHSPHSSTLESNYVNMGWYDVMRANTGYGASERGVVPYHSQWLSQAGWLTITTISSDVLGLRIKDIRASDGVVYRVNVPGSSQYFLLENHQQTNYDAKYDGQGLLIWHVLPGLAWDLESAEGKFTGGSPDPAAGQDDLEADRWSKGSADDFFDGTPSRMTCSTNPSTYTYASASYASSQTGPAPIAFENIQHDGDDILVDVFVTPKQFLTAPNGAEVKPVGQSMTATWTVRPYACISSVDAYLSVDGGSTFPTTLGTGLSNTGSLSFAPGTITTAARVRIVSHDASATSGMDASDANFTVWGIYADSVAHDPASAPIDSIDVTINWDTNIATQAGADLVRFYDAQTGGNQIYPVWSNYTTSNGGLSHRGRFKFTPCIPNVFTYYEVSSTLSGATVAHARTSSTRFKVTACLEP